MTPKDHAFVLNRSAIALDLPAARASALAAGLEQFNEVFDYDLRTPILPEHVSTAADLADLRGRCDIGAALRLALKSTLEVDE